MSDFSEQPSTPLFDVVFYGTLIDGFASESVKASFAKLFKLSNDKVEQIFASSKVVLKPNVTETVAQKFQQALQQVGAEVSLEAKTAVAAELPLQPEPALDTVAEPVASDNEIDVAAEEESGINQTSAEDLVSSLNSSEYGSLAKADAGDFDASIGHVISTAWQNVAGNKGLVWGAFALYVLAIIMMSIVLGFVFGSAADNMASGGFIGIITSQLFQTLVMLPISVGLILVCVKVVSGVEVSAVSVFNYFPKTLNLALTYLLMGLMIILGLMLLVIPGIYLMVAYSLALVLLVDKDLGPWEALETSRKAIHKCWFSVLGLWILLGLILVVAMIPMGIGLIWAVPLTMLCVGVLYRNVFGLSEQSIDQE
jgi:uncharacterized membrane protein